MLPTRKKIKKNIRTGQVLNIKPELIKISKNKIKTMENQTNQLEIKLEIMNVVNKCMLKINSTYDSVALIYHMLKSFDDDSVPPLETDNLPIKIETNEIKSGKVIKENALNWLFCKTFEDFIVGLNESLIEAYIIVKISGLHKENHDGCTVAQLQTKIDEIKKKSIKMYIPSLIVEIEKSINKSLFSREEILSINKVRNCLVHRNGLVSSEDTNNEEKTTLVLKCLEMKVFRDLDEKMIPLTMEDKKVGVLINKATFKIVPKVAEFSIGERVKMDPNILNAITYTSVTFVHELLKSMPIDFNPQDIECNII
jgi:hypothetical protein